MITLTEQQNHLFIEIKGLIDYQKITSFIEQLVSTERYLSMNNIWFFDKSTVGIKFSEFIHLVNFIIQKHPGFKEEYKTRIAIVTSTALEKALATIWVGYAVLLPIQFNSFDNLNDASLWINKQ